MVWISPPMSTDKATPSPGENPKARRTSTRNRKANFQEPLNSTPPLTEEIAEKTKAPAKSGASVKTQTLNLVNPKEEISAQQAVPTLERSLDEISGAEIPMAEIPGAEIPIAETADETAKNNVEIHEGEAIMSTGTDKQPVSLPPAKEGQLVAQASDSNLEANKVVSLMTIAGGQRPIMSSPLEVKGMLTPNRPIFASDLQVYETINVSGLRPVMASPFEVVGSLDAAGHRPIGANEFEIMATINESGIRPIGASSLHITEMLTVSRPIASNDIDDSGSLMGFID